LGNLIPWHEICFILEGEGGEKKMGELTERKPKVVNAVLGLELGWQIPLFYPG
jgi:hypothetical protein